MNSYQDNVIQIEEKRNNIKNHEISLQDNNLTDSLYFQEHWDMKWDTEENLVFMKYQYSLDDLYLCNDYDNVIRNEYKE